MKYKTFKNPKEVEKDFRNRADKLGMGIDKHIFRSVVILNILGFKTKQSCEGHILRYSTYPWIDLVWDEEDSIDYYEKSLMFFYENLFSDLKDFYKERTNTPYDQQIRFMASRFNGNKLHIRLSQLQNSKCFKNKRKEKLKLYLKEINDFCEFLRVKYMIEY